MKVTQKIGGKGKQPGQQDGSVADDKTDQKESQLNLNLKRYGGILLLQTILVFFLWFFGLERVSVTLYDVNFRVFDVFFSLCVRCFICLSTLYPITTTATPPLTRKYLVAINYWLTCTYLILAVCKLVLLVGRAGHYDNAPIRFILIVATIIPCYFEIQYIGLAYASIVEIYGVVGKVKTDVEDPRNRFYTGPKGSGKKKLTFMSMLSSSEPAPTIWANMRTPSGRST